MMRNNMWLFISVLIIMITLMACASETNKEKMVEEEQQIQKEKTSNKDTQTKSEKVKKKESANKVNEKKAKENDKKLKAPQYVVDKKTWSIRPLDEDIDENIVLLTIDDAPDQHALEMAEILKENNAGAIFFVNGHLLETDEQKQILKQIYDMGFIIGNHTYSHAYLPDLNENKQAKEIEQVNEMVEEIIGEKPLFFRAPHGANTDFSKKLADDEEMVLMNWSYGYDFQAEYMEKEALVEIMLQTELLGNGANLLMHDRKWTKDALEEIIIGLREKGYTIVDPNLIQVY